MERYGFRRAAQRDPAQHRHRDCSIRRWCIRTVSRRCARRGEFRRGSASCWRPAGCRRERPDQPGAEPRACSRRTACAASTFVIAGDDRRHARYARIDHEAGAGRRRRRAVPRGRPRRRHAGGLRGVRYRRGAAHRAADLSASVVAEAQAMARPVIASSIGPIPENMVMPPRMPEDLRTGWVVQPGDSIELARALAPRWRSMPPRTGRWRRAHAQFAEYMFAPSRIAAAHASRSTPSLLEAEPDRLGG